MEELLAELALERAARVKSDEALAQALAQKEVRRLLKRKKGCESLWAPGWLFAVVAYDPHSGTLRSFASPGHAPWEALAPLAHEVASAPALATERRKNHQQVETSRPALR